MLKKVLVIFFTIIVIFTIIQAVENIQKTIEPNKKFELETSGIIDVVFIWGMFIVLEFEVFYNILYFGFVRENKTDEKTAINIKCLIRAFISFVGSGTIFVFIMPLLVFLNVLSRIDYFFCRR